MANVIPYAIADVELQLASAISVGATSFTLNSANDDDGNALPAGLYCFTLDSGTSNKEYLIGQLNGVNVTSVRTVNRQGAETSGAARAHRVGAPCIVTNFATLQRVADILRGALTLDGASPISYDIQPSLSDGKQLATVQYVLDTVTGGSVAFDAQIISGVAGETIAAGDQVYFATADQEWYKTDADTAATIEGVQLGIALGSGSDGVAISGGIQIAGTWTTSGLTAGALYYASNTAGARSTSAGTISCVVGLALSTTKLLIIPRTIRISSRQEDAMAGGSTFGSPSSSNKFITQAYNASATGLPVVRTYLNAASPATWTKPTGLKYVVVEIQAAGGNGSDNNGVSDGRGAGGGGGGYAKKLIAAASLGSTETVTIGAVGSNSSFGSHCSANTGANASGTSGGNGGTATGGDINVPGSKGQDGGTTGQSGFGGQSFLSNPALGVAGDTNGNTGNSFGGGGSGASQSGASGGGNGGAGGAAVVIVTEYYS